MRSGVVGNALSTFDSSYSTLEQALLWHTIEQLQSAERQRPVSGTQTTEQQLLKETVSLQERDLQLQRLVTTWCEQNTEKELDMGCGENHISNASSFDYISGALPNDKLVIVKHRDFQSHRSLGPPHWEVCSSIPQFHTLFQSQSYTYSFIIN